jgi:dienelactone hydrolase
MNTDATLGSLCPFIQSQAVQKDWAFSFLSPSYTDLGEWKSKARAKVFELLHYTPPPCDPRPEVVERKEFDGYMREKILLSTTPSLRIPAYILIPKGLKGKAPAIVALHDHGGMYFWGKEKLVENENEHPVLTEFKQCYAGKSVAAELARQGYVVLVADMFYWGERRMIRDDDPTDWRDRPHAITPERVKAFNDRAWQNEQLVGRTIFTAGFTWPGVIFWDDIRCLDYLASRSEVDPQRLGCVGLSVGGLRAGHLAALDERIRAAVAVCWMASFPTQLHDRMPNSIGFTKLIPGLYRLMDYPDVISMAAPRALLAINGSQDLLFEPGGVRDAYAKLQACYAKAGAPERFKGSLYDAPHEFNLEMQAEAWAWLRRWL